MTEKKYKEMIYKKAEKVKTKKDLTKLIDEIVEFDHDYGTIVYGCMAAMLGAFRVVNNSPHGGITGFQAGCLGWECIRKFFGYSGPLRIMDFDKLLYPQYRDAFAKRIDQETWKQIQTKAKEQIKNKTPAHPHVMAHWKKIAKGKVPFGFKVVEAD